jgi:hypothetical protein
MLFERDSNCFTLASLLLKVVIGGSMLKKFMLSFSIVFFSSLAFAKKPVVPVEPRSFDLILTRTSTQPLLDTTIVAFRQIVGEFVTNGYVFKYIELKTPVGGGFHVCIQPTEPDGYNAILEKLQTISAGSMAIWMPTLVESCPTSI